MQDKIELLKTHARQMAANPEFLHHKWFAKWHLEVVEKIALELCDLHPEADRDLVTVVAWMHDYGKILDYDNAHAVRLIRVGRDKLVELGFDPVFADKVAEYVEWHDSYKTRDLREAPIEVQITSSSDACSHIASPFLNIFFSKETDATFADRTFDEMMAGNIGKAQKDWTYKVVLPEAREAFQKYYDVALVINGQLPERFLA